MHTVKIYTFLKYSLILIFQNIIDKLNALFKGMEVTTETATHSSAVMVTLIIILHKYFKTMRQSASGQHTNDQQRAVHHPKDHSAPYV